jgi:transcriptional regulator with XRE-family HTH domain
MRGGLSMSFSGPFMTQNISKMLKNERQNRGLTVNQAALECQLNDEIYIQIELGKKALTTKELIAISSFLKIQPDVLVDSGEQEDAIKFRTNSEVKSSNTIQKAKRLFEEMIAQGLLREN